MKKPAPKVTKKVLEKVLEQLIKKGVVSKGTKIIAIGVLFLICYFLFEISQKLQLVSDYLASLTSLIK